MSLSRSTHQTLAHQNGTNNAAYCKFLRLSHKAPGGCNIRLLITLLDMITETTRRMNNEVKLSATKIHKCEDSAENEV